MEVLGLEVKSRLIKLKPIASKTCLIFVVSSALIIFDTIKSPVNRSSSDGPRNNCKHFPNASGDISLEVVSILYKRYSTV